MPSIAIGVHVHAEPERLKATLASLFANTAYRFDLLLLGDGSDELTNAALNALGNIPQSNTEVSRGVAACFNRLVRHSSTEFCVLLESGAQTAPGWLDALLTAARNYPQCGLVGPSTNRSWNEQGIFPDAHDSSEEIARIAVIASRRFGAMCRTLGPLHSLADFCYLVRREVVEAIGEADETYGLGPCWEMDYNIRAFRAGYQAYWACAAYVHRAPFTARRQSEEAAHFESSRRLYQDKFCGLRLRGLKSDYRSHCRGSACPNFAPPDLIQISQSLPSRAVRPVFKPADQPRVSCILPTFNRRAFIARSLRCFNAQDYPNLELIIVDDGTDPISDVLPDDPRIRYFRLADRLTVGAKRNYACARASGEFIVHWDDDDWYCPSRVRRQITSLIQTGAQVSGSSTLYFYNEEKKQAYRYQYQSSRPWVGGTTLAYRRSAWEQNPFESIQIAEDTKFVTRIPGNLICDLRDPAICVASIHGANVSPKVIAGSFWSPEPVAKIEALLNGTGPVGQATPQSDLPLVSCIMPTYNRRAFLPLSLSCFGNQRYPNRELLVVDDGSDAVGDLLDGDSQLRYLRVGQRMSIGAKRNLACEHARGTFIAHWDDDDWYSSERLTRQIEPLLAGTYDVTGLVNSFVLQMPAGQFWTISEAVHRKMFEGDIHGGTLVYRRSLWVDGIRYPEVNLAEDAMFIRRAAETRKRILRIGNPGLFIYLRHGRNSWKFDCGRFLDPAGWMCTSAPPGFVPETLEAYRTACARTEV